MHLATQPAVPEQDHPIADQPEVEQEHAEPEPAALRHRGTGHEPGRDQRQQCRRGNEAALVTMENPPS